jgi:uncharacterized membrane protein YfcA
LSGSAALAPLAPAPSRFRYWSPGLAAFVALWLVALVAVAPDPLALARERAVYVALGVAGAVIGNISAVGGGIVFIPAFVFLLHTPPVMALKIALATQSLGMSSGALGWLSAGKAPLRALWVAVPGLLIGATVSSLVVHPNALLVKALFGPASILIGAVAIFTALRRRGGGRSDVPPEAAPVLFAFAVMGGLLTGWVAIGEGEVVAASLMIFYGVEAASAIALGVVLLAINSIYLTAIHQFWLGGVPWDYALFTGFGAVFGARLAPWVARFLPPLGLKLGFGVIAIGDGALCAFQWALVR